MGAKNKLLTSFEFVFLSLLDLKQKRYAGDIRDCVNKARSSAGLPEWEEGSFYPLASRLCSAGLVKVSWGGELTGARRKFFLLTKQGLKAVEANRNYLCTFIKDQL
jgi:DNA-binding PadR family transcriptional regulator